MTTFNTTDLFLIKTALGAAIKGLNMRQEHEEEVAIPGVIEQFQKTLDKVNAILIEENEP